MKLVLQRRFVTKDGIWFQENLSLSVARGGFDLVDEAVQEMNGNGFVLVDSNRRTGARIGAPYWLLHQVAGPYASDWVEVVLHGGIVLIANLHATPLDAKAPTGLKQLFAGIAFTGTRQHAWDLLDRDKPGRALPMFRALLDTNSDDTNARYGLALSQLALGRNAAALRNLKVVAPQLGLSDDVRRAMGRAEYQLGNLNRAAALWTEVLRSNPSWEPSVRPWLAAVTRNAPPPNSKKLSQLVAIAMQFMSFLNTDEENKEIMLQLGFRDVFDQVVQACASGHCGTRGGLLAAYDLERGMEIAIDGLQSGKEQDLLAGRLRIADGLQEMAVQETRRESQ